MTKKDRPPAKRLHEAFPNGKTPRGFKVYRHRTPGDWSAGHLFVKGCFPHVRLGPCVPYFDGSGHDNSYVTINCGPSPEMIRENRGGGTTMETAWANSISIAALPVLIDNLERADRLIETFAARGVPLPPEMILTLKAYRGWMEALRKETILGPRGKK